MKGKYVIVVEDRYVFTVKPEEGKNFWNVNPDLTHLQPYSDMLKRLGKRRSGRIMTAIWMVYDPKSKGKIAGRGEKELKMDIATNFLNNPDFDWSEYSTEIKAFKSDCKSNLEKEMDYWETELKARRKYQRSLPWETEMQDKDKLLSSQRKLFEDYLAVLKQLDIERSERKYYAGTQKSLLERKQP